VLKNDLLTRLAIALDRRNMDVADPENMRQYPSAAEFPGAVPSAAKAVTKNIVVDTSHPRWHSTGLYAAPGQIITVDVPADTVNRGFRVRIGAHTDTLWHLDRWERSPDISLALPIRSEHVRVANPFGGLIYLDVPEKTAVHSFTATITGAVEAARFVLAETTPEQWAGACRDSLAPWGEVESSSLILTAPLADLQKLDNPSELLGFWDKIMRAQADLAGWPPTPASPERMFSTSRSPRDICTPAIPSWGRCHWPALRFPLLTCRGPAISRAAAGAITTNWDTIIRVTTGRSAAQLK
jgi:hypothetical protein